MADKTITIEVVNGPKEGFQFQARCTKGEQKGKEAWRSEHVWGTKESAALGAVKHFLFSKKGKARIAKVEARGYEVKLARPIVTAKKYHGQVLSGPDRF